MRFERVVTSEREFREVVGEPSDLALKKQLDRLDEHARAFIARSPFLLMATADAAGRCDVSPKGDAPGFVLVLDESHLVIPDRPGNRRLDGMRNILDNPHVGLIFLVPGREETLRVNGRACVVRDEAILERLVAMGKRPLLAVAVEVEECFLHCAKAFMRSRLWSTEAIALGEDLAPMSTMLWDQTRPADATPAELERRLQEGYARLY
jgi:PPOX class probable FMN-dependent enzyme